MMNLSNFILVARKVFAPLANSFPFLRRRAKAFVTEAVG